MSRFRKLIFPIIGIWVAALIAVFLFPHPFYAIRGFGSLLSVLIGLALITLSIIAIFRDKNKAQLIFALLLVVCVALVVVTKSRRWGAAAYFYLNRHSLEKTVAELSSTNDSSERWKICGENCLIISDDPLRVAFHYSHGFLSWDDIVYDPTGAVNTNDRQKLWELNTYLFGGEPMGGNWYLGHFGD